jgi:MFS family permease
MGTLRSHTRVLRHRDFRLLWLGQSSSVVGDCIVTVALALFVTELTGNPTDLGLVLAAHALPLVAFMPIGGVWADRLPRQRMVVVTDLARFALHSLLALLIVTGEVEIWHVVAIEALFGTAEAFFRPAVTALVPQTVPEPEIQEANALTAISRNVADFAGPALATALVLGAGAATAFAIDAATFIVSAALVVRVVPRRREVVDATVGGSSVWQEVRDGFDEVRRRPWLWVTLAAFCVALFFALAPWFVLGPAVAEEQYGDLAVYGIATAALGVGTIVGSLVAIRWRPRYPMRLAMLFGSAWPLASILYAAGLPVAPVVVAMALSGAGIALFDVWWLTALAERVPADKLARVTSYDWMLSAGLLPLGYLLAGPLADRFGAVEVLVVGSALGFLALVAALTSRELRMLPRIEGTVAELSAQHPTRP